MLAVTIRAHGGPEQIHLAGLPRPSAPRTRDVVVALWAAARDHLDPFVLGGMPGLATWESSGRQFGEVVPDIAA